jgi:hypothetical protein
MTDPVYALNLFSIADRDEYLAYSRRSSKEVQHTVAASLRSAGFTRLWQARSSHGPS